MEIDSIYIYCALAVITVIIIGVLIKKGIKIAACLLVIFLIFVAGFLWLPNIVEKVVNKEMTVSEAINCIKDNGCGFEESSEAGKELISDKFNEMKNIISEKYVNETE